jgi:hypothetical protein
MMFSKIREENTPERVIYINELALISRDFAMLGSIEKY